MAAAKATSTHMAATKAAATMSAATAAARERRRDGGKCNRETDANSC
jgi:hypothetical protein